MRAGVDNFVASSFETFQQWTKQEHKKKVEQRLQTLMDEARKYSLTIFQVVAHTDGWYRKINSEAINVALQQGWRIRVQPLKSRTILIDTNEIVGVAMQDGDQGLMVEITMKKNVDKLEAGTWISSCTCSPKDCDLVRLQ